MGVSEYWKNLGKTMDDREPSRRTFIRSDGKIACGECCWGERCDDRTHRYRLNCPYCLGSGEAVVADVTP